MKTLVIAALFSFSVQAFAEEHCYQVSTSRDFWSRTPEVLCVENKTPPNEFTITLKSGLSFQETIVATFNFNLIGRANCGDCNKNLFGFENLENSVFNSLSIQFDGTREARTMKEKGTVSIGATKLYYRSL